MKDRVTFEEIQEGYGLAYGTFEFDVGLFVVPRDGLGSSLWWTGAENSRADWDEIEGHEMFPEGGN